MEKILHYALILLFTVFLTASFLQAKSICKLGYNISSDAQELSLNIVLPDTSTDYRVNSGDGSVRITLIGFDGIIVSEKDKVEGFIERISLSEAGSPDTKAREILLDLAGSRFTGLEKNGSNLTLRILKFSAESGITNISAEQKYMIGADDKLAISIYNNPDLSKAIQVGKDGKANFALIGDLEVAGLTVSQLTEKITGLYAKDYIVDPQVTIEVIEYNSQSAVVTGEVNIKKKIALRGNTTLKDAIAESGGFTAFAGTEIIISRKKGTGDESEQIRIDRTEFDEGMTNINLAHGDVVTVAKAKYIYMYGEVRRNCDLPLEKGMTLLKAISIAQGLTDWADDVVEILRESPDGQIKEKYNLKRIMDGKSPDVPLKAGDIVIVKKRFL